LPKYFTNKAITLYMGVLVLVNLVFFAHALSTLWWIFGIVEVVCFFYFSNLFTRQWSDYSPKYFTKKLFSTSLIIRIIWVIFSYLFFNYMTGQPFDFNTGDAKYYHGMAHELYPLDSFNEIWAQLIKAQKGGGGVSDTGYILYLTGLYKLVGDGLLIPRLLKALYSSITCVLIYRLAKRSLGEEVGRMAAIFCMLLPNLIYYSGLHLKEAEMVFLGVWFVERADLLIRNKKYTFLTVLPTLLIAASLFFFRTVLGATAIFALFSTLFFSSRRVVSMNKRVVILIWIGIAGAYLVGGRIASDLESVWKAKTINQDSTLKWRAKRENGNNLATKASGAIFAPMIFVIPFPTIVETPNQEEMKMLNGGNYVKNIMAFFVMFALFWVIKEKKWRDYILIGSFTIGYLIIIALSAFAQSERFHQPALPFLMIIAAFGISKVTNNEKKYFKLYMAIIFVAIVGWSWFKLAGRGLT
jgi:hypothetical protein